MSYKITFHTDVKSPYQATILPLDVLHPKIKEEIMSHGVEWLQDKYKVIVTTSWIYLYTNNGNRIDVWL